jgi:hypothetical protein
MNSNLERIRLTVFKIWFLTLIVVVGVYVIKFTDLQGPRAPFSAVFQSLQMMVGLVVPQIGVITAFYFNLDKQQEKINALTSEQVTVITWLSVFYHATFVICTIGGIGFYAFDQTADGNALQRNTAAVLAIMGLFSVCVTPVAFLFAKPKDNAPRPGPDAGANAVATGQSPP